MRRSDLILGLMIALGLAASGASADQHTNLKDAVAALGPIVSSGQAQGDVIEVFPNAWAPNAIGLTIDRANPAHMYYFHENEPNPGIWVVDVAPPHSAVPFTYSKLGGPNTNGGSVRMNDGFIFATDFGGDGVAIDDNIYLFDRTGATVAFWETDVGLAGTPCSGGAVDSIVDVAADPFGPGVYATSLAGNLITWIDVFDTSGGSGAPSSCAILGTFPAPAPITNVAGIEYDPENDGFWLADFDSNNIVLVANDGTFNTVMESLTGDAGAGFNTGVSQQTMGGDPLPLWVTDFGTNATAILDSGTPGLFTVYNDRGMFNAAVPSPIVEDFEEGNVAPGGVQACTNPFDAHTADACWSPGDIFGGVALGASTPGNDMVILGDGLLGQPSIVTGANTFSDFMYLDFLPGVSWVGFDLLSDLAPEMIDIRIYDELGRLWPAQGAAGIPGEFWGVVSGIPIDRIEIEAMSGSGELIDNLAFGPIFADGFESYTTNAWSLAVGILCSHDKCVIGPPQSIGCDPCVDLICAADAYCCEVEWDSICVSEVSSICGLTCP